MAIKIIDVDKVKEDYVRRNLGREVKVLSRLRHPNIVRLFETMMVSFHSLFRSGNGTPISTLLPLSSGCFVALFNGLLPHLILKTV